MLAATLALALPTAFVATAASGPASGPAAPPAASGALAPNLEGDVLSWLEPGAAGEHRLRFSRLRRSPAGEPGWSEPRTVSEGAGYFANWADLPSVVALSDDVLLAHWLEKNGSDPYAYGVRLVRSRDRGETWTDLGWLHRDRSATEHGFVSLLPTPGSASAWAFWLDGGAMASGGPMQLRAARVGERVEGETTLDPRVCECCTTDAALAGGAPLVVYRGRSENEIRDIRIVRRSGDGWSPPKTVADDGWRIAGCPVNGPAVAADGRRVVVAWFTAADDRPRVRLAFSDDGGASFSAPLEVDEAEPRGRVDVALTAGGEAIVVWLGRDGERPAIRLRRIAPDGRASAAHSLAQVPGGRASGFPRLRLAEGRVGVVWRDPAQPARLRFAELDLATDLPLAPAG